MAVNVLAYVTRAYGIAGSLAKMAMKKSDLNGQRKREIFSRYHIRHCIRHVNENEQKKKGFD